MKNLILVLMALVAQTAMAAKTKTTVISAQQFVAEAKDFLEISIQHGELEDIGDECSMNVKVEDGHTYIVLTTASGMKFKSWVEDKVSVKLTSKEDSDGSFGKVYKFGPYKELHITHMDDAYAHATLVNGVTSLNCGVYY